MNKTDKKLISLGSLQHGTRGVTKTGGTKAYAGFLVQLGENGIFDPSVLPPGTTEEEVREIVDEAIRESEERADGKFAPKFVRIDDSVDSCEEIELAMLAVSNLYAIQEHEGNYDNPHAVTKDQVGLGNADNTSDMDKPVSTATMTEIEKVSKALLNNNNPTIGEIASALGWSDQ